MKELTRRDFSKLTMAATLLPLLNLDVSASSKRTLDYGMNQLDWYSARGNATSAPVLVYVHGGAWALGNKGQIGAKARHFTSQGYHFASVGYTLFPAANAQQQTMQVAQAVNWIHLNGKKLGADPQRIALMGHSAGCHLSSLATLTGAALPVKALICNDTRAYDLNFLAKINGGRLPLLYKAPFTRKKMWSAWSPISYTGLKEQPPTLVAWSGGSGRKRISRRFADILEKDGTEVHRFDGARRYSHVSIDRSMGSAKDQLTGAVDRFLQDTLSRSV